MKSMAVKPKVINNGTGRDVVHTLAERTNRREQMGFMHLPCTIFCFLIINLNAVSFART